MKIFTGKVIAKTMDKTATVSVKTFTVHPIYKKRLSRVKKYHVHDELNVKVGQKVNFVASRPYSKTKKWKITGIVPEHDNKTKTKGAKKKK